MKILHVCESLKGGVGSYLDELIPPLQNHFGENNIFLLGPTAHMDSVPKINSDTIYGFKRSSRKSGLLYLAVKYVQVMRDIRPDIVHAHSTFAGVIVRLLNPFFRAKIIYCPHGWAMNMEQSTARKAIVARIEKVLSYLCKRIIAISDSEYQVGINAGISEDKLVTIYSGICAEPPAFTPVIWDDERLKILYVGRFDRSKGPEVLLDAVAPLQNEVSVRMIGGAVIDKFEVDFNEYPHVELLGWQNSSEIAANMSACDVVVIPSRWEAFGLVAVEAMRISKPVIASTVGGLPEIVVDGKTGYLVPANDADSLRYKIISLEKDMLDEMGKAGRKRFIANFTSDKMVEKVKLLYDEMSL